MIDQYLDLLLLLFLAGNAILFVLWSKKSRPYMQFLHFTFAFGAFIAPLLAKQFLLPDQVTDQKSNSTGPDDYSPEDILPITWAYWIGSTPLICAGLFFLAFAFFKAFKEPGVKKVQEHHLSLNHSSSRFFKVVILSLFFLLLLLYVGMEVVYGGYIFAYAVKSKPYMSKNNASYLTACYWGTFAFSRLAAVPLSRYLKPPRMVLLDLIGCLLGGVILISQSQDGCDVYSSPKLWTGTIFLGISAASVFPSVLNWAEYHVEVSGKVASILLVGSCLGEMIVPIAVGNTFNSVGPCSLMYCIFALSFLGILTFAAILLFGRHFSTTNALSSAKFHRKNDSDEPPMPKEQDDDEVLKLLEQNNEIFNGH